MSESENCTHECESCGEDCSSRSFRADLHPLSSVEKVIGIVSVKGGVGKSLVTSLMAVEMQRRGHQTAILDADITGPSIPKAFGLNVMAKGNDQGIIPVTSRGGTDIMSVNLLLQDTSAPVIWRGPAIADVVKQFWSNVIWTGVEYMFVDMPPGTGDVPLTVYQSIPLNGIIIVTSPQELVSMIVEKAVRMAEQMDVPLLGIIENMSYIKCPDCGKEIKIFGESNVEAIAAKHGIKVLAKLPLDPRTASLCDSGDIEKYSGNDLNEAVKMIESIGEEKMKDMRIAVAADESGEIFQHFGHTRFFAVYDIKDGKVSSHSMIDAEGSGHSALGGFLRENNVDLLICGGIGGGAKNVLTEAGIELVSGVSGSIEEAVQNFIEGKLHDDPDAECDHHSHEHEEHEGSCHGCGGHSCH